jgi:hypothetical protein
MTGVDLTVRIQRVASLVRRSLLDLLVIMTLGTACSTVPGAVAPSTVPMAGKYVKLSEAETASSCGATLLTIPLWNPEPVADLIKDLVKSKGGDALIDVTSDSSFFLYLLGVSNCVEIRGKVVKLPH